MCSIAHTLMPGPSFAVKDPRRTVRGSPSHSLDHLLIPLEGKAKLAQVAGTDRPQAKGSSLSYSGQKKSGKDAYYGYGDQELNQGETSYGPTSFFKMIAYFFFLFQWFRLVIYCEGNYTFSLRGCQENFREFVE